MKKIISTLLASCCLTSLIAQEVVVKGPDEKLQLVVSASPAEKPSYSITYNGKTTLSIIRIVLKPPKCIIRQTN